MQEGKPLAIALLGNTGDVYPELLKKNVTPDIVTDVTPYEHSPDGLIPAGLSIEEAGWMMIDNPDQLMRRIEGNAVKVVEAMLALKDRGAVVFEYGNGVCDIAMSTGLERASEIDSYAVKYRRQHLLNGREFFFFMALSGDSADIEEIDELFLREFADDEVIVDWVRMTREIPQFPKGLPLRVVFLHHRQRGIARVINAMVRNGTLKAPIVIHGGEWGVLDADPETTGGMKDGSDVIADWCHLAALVNAAGGADLVTMVGVGSGTSRATRWSVTLDGSEETDERIERLLRVNTELTVTRFLDAGYDEPREMAREMNIRMPNFQ
jgi:urocanate hydratase